MEFAEIGAPFFFPSFPSLVLSDLSYSPILCFSPIILLYAAVPIPAWSRALRTSRGFIATFQGVGGGGGERSDSKKKKGKENPLSPKND